MGRRSKKDKKPPMIRQIFTDNLVRLRDEHFAHLPNKTARNSALAKELDTSLSQVQRLCGESAQESGPSIDILEPLAKIFGISPQDLVTAYFTKAKTTRDGLQGHVPAPQLHRKSG